MVMKMLWWLIALFMIAGPFLIPWWISLNDGHLLFTALNPGTAAIRYMNGKLVKAKYKNSKGEEKEGYITEGGSYDGVILPWKYHLVPCTEPELAGKMEIQKFDEKVNWFSYLSILRKYGIYWIGFPPAQRAWYWFEWSEFSRVPGKGEDVIQREEPTDFFYIAHVEYATKADHVEIGGNSKVDLPFSEFIDIVVPEIAFSENIDIIGQLKSILQSHAEAFYRHIPYDEIKTKKLDKEFEKEIKEIETKSTLGINIREVFQKGMSGEFVATLEKNYQAELVAELEGKAAIMSAKKAVEVAELKAKATNIETDVERRRIEETYGAKAKYPDLARYEAMAKAGAGGNTIVFEGNGNMSDDAKKMLVATNRMHPKTKTDDDPVAPVAPAPTQNPKKKKGGK